MLYHSSQVSHQPILFTFSASSQSYTVPSATLFQESISLSTQIDSSVPVSSTLYSEKMAYLNNEDVKHFVDCTELYARVHDLANRANESTLTILPAPVPNVQSTKFERVVINARARMLDSLQETHLAAAIARQHWSLSKGNKLRASLSNCISEIERFLFNFKKLLKKRANIFHYNLQEIPAEFVVDSNHSTPISTTAFAVSTTVKPS